MILIRIKIRIKIYTFVMSDIEKKIDEILTRGVDEIIEKDHLKKVLISGEKLRIKFGIDPTSSGLHLGHAVSFRKLKQFQDFGHQVIFLIGDFTATIGDPSGKNEIRKMLTKEEIKENMKDYQEQAVKILDMKKVEVRFNSEWYNKKGVSFLYELMSKITVARALERDDFKKRMKDDVDISVLEIIYPLMQGYDSIELEADVEMGGTDQKFNLLMGRKVQRKYKKNEQDIITVPLLEGIDGEKKMSKSLDNYIGITEEPNSMFGKVMSIPDTSIANYFDLCTDEPMDKIKQMSIDMKTGKENPRDLKLRLAEEIVKIYHGKKEAQKAKDYFVDTFSKKETPENIPEVEVSKDKIKLTEFLVFSGNADSLSDARRKIEQGGVEINNKKETDWKRILNKKDNGSTLKIGKKDFVKIKF